jgi:hypothetical protein
MGALLLLRPEYNKFIKSSFENEALSYWSSNLAKFYSNSTWVEHVKDAFLANCLRWHEIEPHVLDVPAAEINGGFYKGFRPYRFDIIPKDVCSDPFSWFDRKYKTTLAFLEIYQPKVIKTRSDLIAHDQYIEALPKWCEITLYYDSVERQRAAGFPSRKRLQTAMDKIKRDRPDISITIKRYRSK